MPPKPLEPGDPLRVGRFELLARLGEGGQGIVYLGRGARPGEERVAVKVLRSSADATVLERLARELDAIHQVQPFVTAGVIEASVEGDRRFIISEFINGPSLQEHVDSGGPLPEGDLLRLAVGTATALTAIHGAGVVHRDFKPANVLLGPGGPRVVDFGIARITDAATITSGVIGTPSYVSPEQLAGARPTSAVDLFAWAATMVFAATGRPAFGGGSVPAVMQRILHDEPDLSGLPPSLLPVVRQCLDKDPRRRPSARDLLLRLVDPSAPPLPAARSGRVHPGPVMAEPAPTGPRPARPSRLDRAPARTRRGRVLAVCGAVAVALLIGGTVLLLTRGSPARPTAGADGRPGASRGGGPPATTNPADGATIPSKFAGTWTGTATMAALALPNIGLPNRITFTFAAGARTVREHDQGCINTLTLSKETATALVFSEPQTTTCAGGTVTFTRRGANLAYRWTDNTEENKGTLHKA